MKQVEIRTKDNLTIVKDMKKGVRVGVRMYVYVCMCTCNKKRSTNSRYLKEMINLGYHIIKHSSITFFTVWFIVNPFSLSLMTRFPIPSFGSFYLKCLFYNHCKRSSLSSSLKFWGFEVDIPIITDGLISCIVFKSVVFTGRGPGIRVYGQS